MDQILWPTFYNNNKRLNSVPNPEIFKRIILKINFICKLKNIFCLSTGTTPKDFDKISEGDSLINWYTPSDILDSCNDLFSAQRKLSEKVIYENKLSLFPIGTLLYVGIGASAGKVGYANECGYSNQQITGLIPLKCYSRFYFYYLSVLKDNTSVNFYR